MPAKEYASTAKILHWLVAALIIVQYVLIELAERADHHNAVVKQLALLANHKSIGITILLLAIVRLIVRLRNPAPSLPSGMPHWQTRVSKWSHGLLYALLVALPITGWLMSSANAYSVSWFNVIALPDLIAPSDSRASTLASIHSLLSDGLLVLAILHIAAAFKHHWFDKDDVLTRMLSPHSLTIFVAALFGSLALFGQFSGLASKQAPQPSTHAQPPAQIVGEPMPASSLPIWQIDYQTSFIKFGGEQAGAAFTGEWKAWSGELQFSPSALSQARFQVEIDIDSVNSNDDERDDHIRSADFFDVANFPKAYFSANLFTQTADGYEASGQLKIKDLSFPCTLAFTIDDSNDQIKLTGQATLNRHTWNVGIGDWQDPTWVGSDVSVDVSVNATLK